MTVVRGAGTVTVREIIRRIDAIPMHLRRFSETRQSAMRTHGIPADLLDTLMERGLPHVGSGATAQYDPNDLANVSAGLGLPSGWAIGQRTWPMALEMLVSGVGTTYDLTVEPRCPRPGHEGPCDFEILLRDGGEEAEPTAAATGRLTGPRRLRVQTTPGAPIADASIAAVLSCLDEVSYLQLPEELDGDMEFFDRTGLASCVSAAAAVSRYAKTVGVATRQSYGLVILPPFAGQHCWVEFKMDGRWVAFDPHLVRFLEESGILRAGWWPRVRSVGGLLLRLGDHPTSLAAHGALHAEISFSLRRVG